MAGGKSHIPLELFKLASKKNVAEKSYERT